MRWGIAFVPTAASGSWIWKSECWATQSRNGNPLTSNTSPLGHNSIHTRSPTATRPTTGHIHFLRPYERGFVGLGAELIPQKDCTPLWLSARSESQPKVVGSAGNAPVRHFRLCLTTPDLQSGSRITPHGSGGRNHTCLRRCMRPSSVL
jgi:hypothetical protein